ncbi:GNAT family N-acetyltransferase [Wukongibacter baidiensis]|uniref:GNAT family N-acetyltransferase n=1 Tax=Wukongibacter baidiensis TaxID=1723361 RepID=UPI003D7FC92B
MYRVGDKTKVRRLKREDVDRMLLWGKHESPEFLHYNFPELSESERDLWYKIKARDFRRRCFAIEDMEDNLVGYISLRNMKFFKKQSELGIVFDPNKLSEGYGTDGLCTFLDLYFNNLRMRTLILKVAKFNKRALRCYQKCGFEIFREVFDEFEEQNLGVLMMKKIEQSNKEFKIKDGKLMTNYYYMHITRGKYLFHKENKELLITL